MLIILVLPIHANDNYNPWKEIYNLVIKPPCYIGFDFEHIKSPEPLFSYIYRVALEKKTKPHLYRLELDGKDIRGMAAIHKKKINNQKIIEIRYRPSRPLKPGFHLFTIEAGNFFGRKIVLSLKNIDPDINITRNTKYHEMTKILNRLQKQRAKIDSVDYRFNLQIDYTKNKKNISSHYHGKLYITGENIHQIALAEKPITKVNGKIVKTKRSLGDYKKTKKMDRMRLNPFYLSNYIPYQDLAQYYNWHIYKRIGKRSWIFGDILPEYRKELWLPQFVQLVIDEKRWLPLEINTFIYNNKHVTASAKLEYNKEGLLTQQTLKRILPDGKEEISVLKLSENEINKREAAKKGIHL